jgi:hypothetical protein
MPEQTNDVVDVNYRLDAVNRAMGLVARAPHPELTDLLAYADSIYRWLSLRSRRADGQSDEGIRLQAYDRSQQFNSRWSYLSTNLPYLLDAAETIYKYLVSGPIDEVPVQLNVYVSDPYEQGTSTPISKGTIIVAVQMRDTQQVRVSVEAVDSKGNQVESGNLTWTSDNETVATITVDPDNAMAAIIVAGSPGAAVVTVSDGNLSGQELITVTAGAAASFSLSEGPITEQPAAATPPAAAAPGDGGVTNN